MTKSEMLEALKEGHKVTHTYFTSDEWMKDGDNYDIEFEDGCKCSFQQFWQGRNTPDWNEGWSLYSESNINN